MQKLPHYLLVLLISVFACSSVNAQRFSVSGIITEKDTRQPIEQATVYLTETGQGCASVDKGYFEIKNINEGTYHFCVTYLGYEPFDTILQVNKPVKLSVRLLRTSLKLKEINVMAREKKVASTTSTMNKAAIEHLQPSSISDVLQLLPGGLISDSKLNSANQVSMRQAGSDINTALGTAIVQDGVPLSNDFSMQSIYGASSTDVSATKSPANSGIDLRQISTDHIDEVEVIRGIPSVQYGNLTSGAIIIKSKKGKTPLTVRVKSDPLNKLVYAGKGFLLPNDGGTVNFGVDYTNYVADQRSPFDKYQRITSNLSYEKLINKVFLSTTQLGYTGTIDKLVNDPDIMNKEDSYKSDYKSLQLSNSGKWNLNKGLLNKIEYSVSANYANEFLDRTKTVTLNSPMGISLSKTEGEAEGIYLPSEYLTTYTVDGKPLQVFTQVMAHLNPSIGKTLNNVLVGGEFRLEKNYGNGSDYNFKRPPFPNQSSSSRPRAPKDIPSMQKSTLFAEDNLNAKIGRSRLILTAGIRGTLPGNISSESAMYHKIYLEPRVNVRFLLPKAKIFDETLEFALKGGFGDQIKFPTAMQLYPEIAYYDIPELNYYSTSNEGNRLVYLLTVKKDRTNNDLKPARNRKFELGFDMNYMGFSFNLTAFLERERNGFETQSLYFPQSYKLYSTDSYSGTGKPTINDFTSVSDTMFLPYSYVTNSAVVVKEGIEYQMSLRKIKAINTEIVLNGAWFHTRYDISQPRYEYPMIVTGGDYYPYVGIYNAGKDSKLMDQFNSTVFFNTHLSRQRLLFSTSIQAVWFSSYQMLKYSGFPDYYIDLNGEKHQFTDTEKADPAFKPLIEPFLSAYFDPEVSPISLEVNLKVTKEIGQNLNLSFFVNRLLDYNPRYTTRFGVSTQKWATPFMGAEIQIKI